MYKQMIFNNNGSMRKILSFLSRSKFVSDKSKQIIQQYNKAIRELKQVKDEAVKDKKLNDAIGDMNKKIKAMRRQEQLHKIKKYLIQGLENNTNSSKKTVQNTELKQYIPKNLVIKKLKFLDKKILMLGVEEQNEQHCIYLKRIAEKMDSRIIFTAIPPDMPYFIKTELSFTDEWRKFVTSPSHAKQCKFYLNPIPFHINNMCLQATQKQLVRNSLNSSNEFNQIFYTILQHSKRQNKFLPNALLTPLLISNVQKIYFCDYPVIKERQMWALTIPTPTLRELFQVYRNEYHKQKQTFFDPRILFPKKSMRRKFQHMANTIKYASHEAFQPAMFVCPAEYAEMFCMQWAKDEPLTPYSDFSYPQDLRGQVRFIDFVQNLVIMDFILEPVIQKYFIKYLSFPYTALQTIGGKENIGKIFIVWNHYYNLYKQALLKQPSS